MQTGLMIFTRMNRVIFGRPAAEAIVEEAIILEDDCLPDPSFFLFCQELLRRYRDDDTIAGIGGMAVKGGGQIRDTAITSPSIFIPPGGPLGSVPGRSSIIR